MSCLSLRFLPLGFEVIVKRSKIANVIERPNLSLQYMYVVIIITVFTMINVQCSKELLLIRKFLQEFYFRE